MVAKSERTKWKGVVVKFLYKNEQAIYACSLMFYGLVRWTGQISSLNIHEDLLLIESFDSRLLNKVA